MRTRLHGFFLLLVTALALPAAAQVEVRHFDRKHLQEQVVQHFLKSGIQVTHITSRLHVNGTGIFKDPDALLGIREGIILSTGSIDSIRGPNDRVGTSTRFPGFDHYQDDNFITGHQNYDAMVLIIDFIPLFDSIAFEYCFGSEEYPEFVGSDFNDLFVLYVQPKGVRMERSTNIARLPDQSAVSINSVNGKKNSAFFTDNTPDYQYNKQMQRFEPFSQSIFDAYEYDGFTKLLTAGARVIPGREHELKIIICDLNDANFDSGILLKSRSFRSLPGSIPAGRKPAYKKFSLGFDVAKASLEEKYLQAIPDLAEYIRTQQIDSVYLVGHTDSTGIADSNAVLSVQRAQFVRQLLIKEGVPETIIRASGKGSSRPVKSNATPEGRRLNRRVDIVFYRH